MTPASPIPQQRAHALSALLARCIAGQVAETQLNALADLVEASDAAPDERAAFARFYLDVLTAEGDIALPRVEELKDLLSIARA